MLFTKPNSIVRRRRRGMTLLFAVICMAALLAIVSLGIDLGRVQTAKTELQRAVDAAARYGAIGLPDGTTIAKAIEAGRENAIDAHDKQALTLTAADISTGIWDRDTQTFNANATPPNAVRITTSRTIPLLFASAIGKSSCAITATAICVNNAAGPNFIGLASIYGKNNAAMGYNSTLGNPGNGNQTNTFLMASNGSIVFQTAPSINGGIILGPNGSYNQASPIPLTSSTALFYPPTENPPFVSSGNLSVSGTVHIAGGGTKVYTDINFNNNSTLIFDSPTTVYVTGSVHLANSSTIAPASNVPKDLMIRMTGGPSAVFEGNNGLSVTAMIYAPSVDFSSKNNADLYGSMLFRDINVSNNLNVFYDTASGSVVKGVGSVGGSNIAMVR